MRGRSSQDDRVRRYFSGVAPGHTSSYNTDTRAGFVYSCRSKLVADVLDGLEGGRLLDAGCGTAVMEPVATARGFEYVGFDLSEEMVEEAARSVGPTSSVSVGSVERIPYPSNHFDVVLALGVLEYVEPESVPTALDEIERVAKHDGVVIMSVLNRASPVWALRPVATGWRALVARLAGRDSERPPEHTYTRRRLRRLTSASHMSERTSFRYGFAPVPSGLYATRPSLFAGVALELERLEGTPADVLALAHFMIMSAP